MSASERTGTRNLALSAWRRWPNMPHRFTAIDIDLLGYCSFCHAPLFLIEAVQGSLKHKATFVIERLSWSLSRPIPVALIGYTTTDADELATLDAVIHMPAAGGESLLELHSPAEWKKWESWVRMRHARDCEGTPE